jgi:hypothetical protein
MAARSVEGKVRAIVGMETRGMSPDALSEVASALKVLVRSSETALRTVNKAGESWPVDSLAVWAPDGGGPQIELQIDMVSSEDQQMAVA